MPSASEGFAARGPLASAQEAGVKLISENQLVKFTKYVRLVLPLDGFVFWVRADLLNDGAEMNVSPANVTAFNQPSRISKAARAFEASGSLHYMANQFQTEDENFSINRVIFTANELIQQFDNIGQDELYLGEFDGLRFAFSQQEPFYRQAQEWHYQGDAVYPSLESQIIDDLDGFDTRDIVVSNSLPVWLQLNAFMPLYPSFLTPDNLRPPYGVVHIPPESTRPLQAVPLVGPNRTHSQLVCDRVKITMYGLRNFQALDFQDYVNQYSLDTDVIGLMNTPIIRDEKRTQNELNVIAMKKSIEFEVSYYQLRVNDVARQFIKSCIPSYHIAP